MSTEPAITGTPRERALRRAAEAFSELSNACRELALAEGQTPPLRAVLPRDASRLMTRQEVGERLRKSGAWVRRACVTRKLAGIKVGGEWTVKESDVEAFIRRGERAARS